MAFRVFRFSSLNLCRRSRSVSSNVKLLMRTPCPKLTTSYLANRNYSVEKPQELSTNDESSGNFVNLDKEFHFVDSILKRGGYLRKKTIENLLQHVKANANEVTPLQALFLLKCCGKYASLENQNSRNVLASKIWNTLNEIQVPLDISHYNSLLQIFLENEHKFSPLDFLASLEKEQIEPNRITYSRLIAKFCQDGDLEGANKILEYMKEKELPIGEYVFNQLITGNSRANDLEAAKGVIDVMKQTGIPPTSETYVTLLKAFLEHKDLNSANELLEQCESDSIFISDQAMLELVCDMADTGAHQSIKEILTKLRKREGYQNMVSYAVNRLLQSGHDEIAYAVFQTLDFNAENRYTKSFFPKQLAAAKLDLYKVANYCEEIKQNGWNVLSYELALESFLFEEEFDMAIGFLRIMSEKGMIIKDHYFYPIFKNLARQNDKEKIFDLFEEMVRMEVPFENFFISTFLLTSLKPTGDINELESFYMRLSSTEGELNVTALYNGFIEYLLLKHSTELAAQFVKKIPRSVDWSTKGLIIDSYNRSLDVASTVSIARQMLPLSYRVKGDFQDTSDDAFYGIKDFLGLFLFKVRRNPAMLDEQFIPIVKEMEVQGVAIPTAMIDDLKNKFQDVLNVEAVSSLEKLSHMDTMLTNYRQHFGSGGGMRKGFDEKSLRRQISETESSEESSNLNVVLLINLIRQKKLSEVQELLESMKMDGLEVPPAVQVMIFDLYFEEKKFDLAENTLNQLMDKHQNFQIMPMKIIKWALSIANQGLCQDIAKVLLMNSPKDGEWPTEMKPKFEDGIYRNYITNLLSHVASNDDIETLKLIQEALLTRQFTSASTALSPLIKYHLNKDDLEEAMKLFESFAAEHKVTAGKEILTVACIEKEDTEKIQRIMDISIDIHGEMNTLYDLVFAFLEVGKTDQARKIFETNGLRTFQNRLNSKCEYYLRNRKISQLDGLVQVTKGLFNIDRQAMWFYLLQGKILEDDPQQALGVWTSMQEEGVDPSKEFLLTLKDHLVSKGLEVPFTVQSSSLPPRRTPVREARPVVPSRSSENDIVKELRRAIGNQRYGEAKDIWNRGIKQNFDFSLNLCSEYIVSQLRNNDLMTAVDLAKDLVSKGQFPGHMSMRLLLEKLAENGDVTSLEFFGKFLDEDRMRSYFYNNQLGLAYCNADRTEEFLSTISETLQNGGHSQSLTPRVVRYIVSKKPEFVDQLKHLAEKEKSNGSLLIFKSIFDSFFGLGKTAEAEEIYESYLKDENNLSARFTCSESFLKKDTSQLEELLKIVDRKPEGREAVKGFIYSTYVDILNKEGKYDEAVQTIDNALKSIKLEDFNLNRLSQLKQSMEGKGLSFPYKIPTKEKQTVQSSTSSSSDSEDEKK